VGLSENEIEMEKWEDWHRSINNMDFLFEQRLSFIIKYDNFFRFGLQKFSTSEKRFIWRWMIEMNMLLSGRWRRLVFYQFSNFSFIQEPAGTIKIPKIKDKMMK
jgi:hypothetical protein